MTDFSHHNTSVIPRNWIARLAVFWTLVGLPIGCPGLAWGGEASVTALDSVMLLRHDDSWRFEMSGTDLGADWRVEDYDDRHWPAGPGAFGWEDFPLPWAINTHLSIDSQPAYYFRTDFVFLDDPVAFDLLFTNLIDDGAVFYLNGHELFRLGMDPGPVEFNTVAARQVNSAAFETVTMTSEHLRLGTNVLAVEVHQSSTSSGDVVFGTSLTATRIPVEPLAIIAEPRSVAVEEGRTVAFSVGVTGRPARYQWFHDGTALPGADRSSYEIAEARGEDVGVYWARVFNELSELISAPAGLRVLADTTPPDLLRAEGAADMVRVTAVFSESLGAASASDMNHYRLTNTWGEQVPIVEAQLIDRTNVLLSTATRRLDANYILTVEGIGDAAPGHNVMEGRHAAPVSMRVELIPWDGEWSYYDPVPPFDPLHPGPGWQELDFETTAIAWGIGSAAFIRDLFSQYWPVPRRTSLDSADRIAVYFRHEYSYFGSRLGARMELEHLVDDGAVFYVNGGEIHRLNMPGGDVDEATPALEEAGSGMVPIVKAMIEDLAERQVQGDNVLAVELHASAASGTDMAFAARLEAWVHSQEIGPVVITRQPSAQTVVEGQTARFDFDGAGPSWFQWYSNQVAIAGATGAVLRLARVALASDELEVSVHAGNDFDSVWSEMATLRVLPDLSRPTVAAATILPELDAVEVVFSEPVDPVIALQVGNYGLEEQGAVLDAAMMDERTVRLATSILPFHGAWLELSGIRDRSTGGHEIRPGTRVPLSYAGQFLSFDSVWTYDQSGTDLGEGWRDNAFDDSAWSAGMGVLGFPESESLPGEWAIRTVLSPFTSEMRFVTNFYFRTRLPIQAPFPGIAVISNVVDDGGVFYLNGTEVGRLRMPQGPITHHTFASRTYDEGGSSFKDDVLVIDGADFVLGENRLAVEVHQVSYSAADLVFGCEVFVQTSPLREPELPELRIELDGNESVLRWELDGFELEETENLEGDRTVWYPVRTLNTSVRMPVLGVPKFFRLRD